MAIIRSKDFYLKARLAKLAQLAEATPATPATPIPAPVATAVAAAVATVIRPVAYPSQSLLPLYLNTLPSFDASLSTGYSQDCLLPATAEERHVAQMWKLIARTAYDIYLAQHAAFTEQDKRAMSTDTATQPEATATASIRSHSRNPLREKATSILGKLPSIEAWNNLPQAARKVALKLVAADLDSGLLAKVSRLPNPNYPGQFIQLDPDQLYAVLLFLSGKSFVLTGSAGTGKTLTEQALAVAYLIVQDYAPRHYNYKIPLRRRTSSGEKTAYAPACFIGAFTNKAVGVLSRKILANPELAIHGFGYNLSTIHALLEFEPVEMWSDIQERMVRRYLPARTKHSPLTGLEHIIIDEASTVGVGKDNDLGTCQLWTYLYDALEQNTQVVLVGDLNQLPPVGGKSILSYGVAQLPVHELTYFHRQAAESPIIAAAHTILKGGYPTSATNTETGDTFQNRTWKPELAARCKTVHLAYDWFKKGLEHWIARGEYDPMQDMLLTPYYKENNLHTQEKEARAAKRAYQKSVETGSKDRGNRKRPFQQVDYFSAKTLNRIVGTYLARKEGRPVYCIQAGYERHYLSIGDRVLVQSVEGCIEDIRYNYNYTGKPFPRESVNLDYWGKRTGVAAEVEDFELTQEDFGDDDANPNRILRAMESTQAKVNHEADKQESERDIASRAASHEVIVRLENDELVTLATAGAFQPQIFQLAYALTVHKAQGSEWRNVFLFLHPSQNKTVCREIVYTGVTRARNACFLFGSDNTYRRAIANPHIKGDTLAAKIEHFLDGAIDKIDLSKLA